MLFGAIVRRSAFQVKKRTGLTGGRYKHPGGSRAPAA
jgi:hypothetical protein